MCLWPRQPSPRLSTSAKGPQPTRESPKPLRRAPQSQQTPPRPARRPLSTGQGEKARSSSKHVPRGAKGGAAHVGDGAAYSRTYKPTRPGPEWRCCARQLGGERGRRGGGRDSQVGAAAGNRARAGLGGFPIREDSQAHSQLHSQLENFGRLKYVIMGNNKPVCNKEPIVTLSSPRHPALKRLGRGQGPGSSLTCTGGAGAGGTL